MRRHDVDVLIVGGGPAGMVLGLLLAKQGVRTLVLERHHDFAREYRGEVLMPRFTKMLRALGLFERLQDHVHRRLEALEIHYGSRRVARLALSSIDPDVPFALWMPQPILLQFLAGEARAFDAFDLWFGASPSDRILDGERTVGLSVRRDDEEIEVHARVTVGADGRFSRLRRLGGFQLEYEEHDFDVLWFTIPEPDTSDTRKVAFRAFLTAKRAYLALPKHPDAIQCGMLLPKDGFREYKRRGIESLRADLLAGPPLIHPFARELEDFTPFNVLQGTIELVERWARDGLLLIGDAAHTCSPAGAIGVSVAVETAIRAAEILPGCLSRGDVSADALGAVQRRREADVRAIQKLQRGFGGLVTGPSPWRRRAFAALAFVAARVGLARIAPRRLVTFPGSFTVDPKLVFAHTHARDGTAEAPR